MHHPYCLQLPFFTEHIFFKRVTQIADENEDEGFTGVAQASGAATGAAIVGGALAAVGGEAGVF